MGHRGDMPVKRRPSLEEYVAAPKPVAAEEDLEAVDRACLQMACQQSFRAPQSDTAYSVGCVLIADGRVLATGYSRELEGSMHAEEVALTKMGGCVPEGCTLYSSMEPCSVRKSGKMPCTEHILSSKVGRVVFGAREPDVFVQCDGVN